MFDFVRTHTRLLQFILVLLIFPSFVFFGIQGYSSFTDAGNATVAKVGGMDIKQSELDQAHKQQVARMQQQMPGVDVKLFDTPEMKARTLDSLVRDRVMRVAAAKENLVITNDRLDRSFKTDPQFAQIRSPDGSVSKEFLSARGMTSAGFAQELRDELAKTQVLAGVSGSLVVGKTANDSAVNAILERREVQLQPFMTKSYLDKVNPTDADLEAYYKSHESQFRSSEEARIEYVVLDLEALKKQITLSEDDLRKYYEQNIARYTSAEERHAAHILVNAAKDAPAADRAKAKEKAEGLLAEARKNPAGFAELAKKNSDDKGSATNGGDLDFFGRGAMVKPFEDAAFAMKPGEISNVVESEFGFHIIKLLEVRGGEKKPFESVRAQIVEEVSKPKAQEMYAAAAEQFSNMVYEQSDSLQPVIDKLKLSKAEATVQRAPAPGASGPLASPKLLEAIFSTDAVKNKRNTEAVETGPNQLVSARIVEHHPERVLPLAEVRDRVLAAVKAEQATAIAKKDGEARVAALKQKPDDTMPAAATLSRQSRDQPRPVIEAVLRADLSKGPAVIGIDLGNDGFMVARVTKRIERDAKDPDNERAKSYVAQQITAAESAAYYEALKRRYKVKLDMPAAGADAASAAGK
ncbi:MAG TPA: SurA N-terminal domain-containing protein [Ideonella sp.]|uniref:SurA N-terminal domain-containing protein n=1 Tax=Ideonella sp. TaxID=1929293 RepID=UPI002E2F833A|nr:SurA N-terminal domain-containing protein [Ideonella sp.]HEX5684299.1 SurA N-terminal domain-containing protein [Ideonella sp.]